ncbi:hypothetical protein HHK36_024543 [Tetracentron sinense]|uniref:Uncharacterized protein n=1 Tax=Tetracentron sinense TaxID=13715 RepID=A0A834YQ60_TETSI|nr:hypothetical protein HHK36_024543 [Tetracentron sinense]
MIRNMNLSRLKSLISTVETLNHQFMQQCSVNGTAIGKGKIKTAQPLKRSTIPKKKGAGSSSGVRGRLNEATECLNKMVDSCLNAPMPIQYLTPKQEEQVAEREKQGLISKDRQRELDMLKSKKSGKDSEESLTIMGTLGLDLIPLSIRSGVVNAKDVPKYELTVEDGRQLAKEYSRALMRRHLARQASESTLLRLKKEVIEALLENLKAAALVPDLTPFPVNWFMAMLTPPIEGYIEKVKEAARTLGRRSSDGQSGDETHQLIGSTNEISLGRKSTWANIPNCHAYSVLLAELRRWGGFFPYFCPQTKYFSSHVQITAGGSCERESVFKVLSSEEIDHRLTAIRQFTEYIRSFPEVESSLQNLDWMVTIARWVPRLWKEMI